MTCSFKFEVRQNMLQISNSLQRRRHFCFDANPYPTGRRGLRRNRNVWTAASSELSHFKLESTGYDRITAKDFRFSRNAIFIPQINNLSNSGLTG